ncbi:hypothetical protein HKD37_09G024858 [Glycine soja]
MDEEQWMYDNIMSEEVDMNIENEEDAGVKVEHVDCSDAFNTSHLFATRDEVLHWARLVAHEIGFVAMIMRSDTNIGVKGRISFLLIAFERSDEYRPKKNDLLRAKPILGREEWMVKLICGTHNHVMEKSFVGHNMWIVVANMTKSMVKPRNILLMLKEHNANSYTTIKQIYNARNIYRSSIRRSNLEIQQLMMLLDRDQYIHWYRMKDENVVRDLFWSHPDAVKLTNSCNLIFFLLTIATKQIGEYLNNIVWALQWFWDLLMKVDALPKVIVTDKNLSLMRAVKTVFPDVTNLLRQFHIDKNMKAKCKTLVAKQYAWHYVMEAWGSLVDCPCESYFDEYLKNFEKDCSPWPMFVDYVCQTWVISHKEKFVKAWTNKVMHLGNTTTNTVESVHWSLKRFLQNNLGDICSVWEATNNKMTLQHTQIKASFETSTNVVGHVFKVTLYKKLLGMVSRYALNEIAAKYECIPYVDKNPSLMRTTHGLPCVCDLSKYVVGSIPLEINPTFWRRLNFSDQGLCEAEVTITEEMETMSVATYPFAGERGEAHGCVFQRRKMRRVATNVICEKRWKNRREPIMKNIPDSGVVFTFEEGRQKRGSCFYVPSLEEQIRPT